MGLWASKNEIKSDLMRSIELYGDADSIYISIADD